VLDSRCEGLSVSSIRDPSLTTIGRERRLRSTDPFDERWSNGPPTRELPWLQLAAG
jgi:hypothetical protein